MALEQESVALRSGTTAEWAAAGTILGAGEFGLDTTTRDVRIGDGSSAFTDLVPVSEIVEKGTAVLVTGAKVVTSTKVAANSIIILTTQVLGTVSAPKPLAVTARSAGVSFTITSSDATDTSTVGYLILTP